MREKLANYVDLLFAGAPGAYDMKEEILRNTLDRYDDLISQGKAPEAAYSLSISGIGDISDLLGSAPIPESSATEKFPESAAAEKERKARRVAAIMFYILCPIPLFILSEYGHDTLGLCMTLLIVAAATGLLILSRPDGPGETGDEPEKRSFSPHEQLRSSIGTVSTAVTLALYLVLSFATQAWLITWLVFPIGAAVKGLIWAILDLKEATSHEI